MLKAVIFDLDGVVVETEPQTFRFYQEHLKQFDITLRDEDFSKKVGRKSVDFFRDVLSGKQAKDINITELIALKRKRFLEDTSSFISKVEGVNELLTTLKQQALHLALASQNEDVMIEKVLDWVGIKSCFEVILSLQDIQHKKPHPQIYLLAAQKLGVSPKESLVIEDSLDGILSAKAAGMRCVALRHPYTPPQHLLQADWVVDNLKKIPLLIKAI